MMNLDLIFPEIFLSLSIMFLLMIGVFKKNSEKLVYNLSIISLIILLALVVNLFSINEKLILNDSYKIDSLSSFKESLTIVAAIFVMISSTNYLKVLNILKLNININFMLNTRNDGDDYSNDLILLFGLELQSLALYACII